MPSKEEKAFNKYMEILNPLIKEFKLKLELNYYIIEPLLKKHHANKIKKIKMLMSDGTDEAILILRVLLNQCWFEMPYHHYKAKIPPGWNELVELLEIF